MSNDSLRRYGLAAVASVGAVAAVTGVIALIEQYVPVLSLGVLYIFAVLPVAVVWGLGFALPVSVASMLAFNWFFLPPRHTFSLADSENWFALAVYLATAVVVSELAASARRRAAAAEQRERESALLAGLATELLGGRKLAQEVGEIANRAATVLGVDHAEIELGSPRAEHGRQLPIHSRPPADVSARSTRRSGSCPGSRCAVGSSLRSRRCSPSPPSESGSKARRSRPRCFGAATSSRRRCYGRSRMTCARR